MVHTEIVDQALLDALCAVVTPDIVEEAVQRAVTIITASEDERCTERATLDRALAETETRISRFVASIAAGGPIDSLVASLKVEEERRVACARSGIAWKPPAGSGHWTWPT